MAEYWKSTPKYWCKFCEVYVRDTGIEKRNHEASGKHQGAIQRSLREVHKGKQQQEREQNQAKNEVARLNKLVGSKPLSSSAAVARPAQPRVNPPRIQAPARTVGDAAAQRRAMAEQWAAMGVPVPKELQEVVTGEGAWQTVSERVIGVEKEEPRDESSAPAVHIKGVHKRKADDEEGEEDFQPRVKKAWGSKFKSYESNQPDDTNGEDLDALLSGVGRTSTVKTEPAVTNISAEASVKTESDLAATDDAVKQEENGSAITAPPVVTFKKRKAKR